MKTSDLMAALAEDAAVPWTAKHAIVLAIVCGAGIAAMIFVAGIGPRPDVVQAAETARFLFKFVVTLALAVPAVVLVFRIARPGVPVHRWGWALVVAPVLLCGAVLAELLLTPQSAWSSNLVGTNAPYCLTLIPLMAIGPLACILLALRQGAPARPGLAGAIAGLAASGIAATFYAAHCNNDSPLFVAAWYPLAIGIVVLVGYFAGSRLLRW